MTDPLDTLDALLAAATPRPWYADGSALHRRAGVEPSWIDEKIVDCCEEFRGGRATGNLANARLIAEMRNAAPELIAVARAAEERDGCAEQCLVMRPYRGCTCGDEGLRAALAAMRARLGGDDDHD